jgi:hypothetical protein
MRRILGTFGAVATVASLTAVGCGPELDAPVGDDSASTSATSPTAVAPVQTATVALAEFEGFADPATGRFEIERVTSIDPYPQLAAIYEGHGIRTIGQGISVAPQPTLPLSEPAPWCTGRIVTDGTAGSNPPDSFELLTLPGSIAFSPAGDAPNSLCITPGLSTISSFLYGAQGVFCAEVRAHNFYDVPWNRVHAQLYQFSGGSGFSPYALGLGTSVNTNDFGGVVLPEYAGLPDPGGAIALWSYGDLAAGGGAGSSSDQVWTFRRASSGTSAFRFRGRVVGNVAENCGTLDINEDCDPLDRADNACRLYATGATCTDDRDCVSYACSIVPGASTGVCEDECAAGLYGIACQFECPGGITNVCSGNGSCDDGRSSGATGACACATNFYGADCSIACSAGQTWTQAGGCQNPPPAVLPASRYYATYGAVCALSGDGSVVRCVGPEAGTPWTPVQRSPLVGSRYLAAHGSYQHSCGLREVDGAVECWGANVSYGIPDVKTPPVGLRYTAIHTGYYTTCGILSDGRLDCWGTNLEFPTGIRASQNGSPFVAISGTYTGRCALRADGVVECFGNPSYYPSVRAPSTASPFVHLSGGEYITCAMRADSVVECWGSDQGVGATPPSIASSTAAPFVSISSGALHTCARRADGTMQCWGYNAYGQAPVTSGGVWDEVVAGLLVTCRSAGASVSCIGSFSGTYTLP